MKELEVSLVISYNLMRVYNKFFIKGNYALFSKQIRLLLVQDIHIIVLCILIFLFCLLALHSKSSNKEIT